jgi:hypothetical protein
VLVEATLATAVAAEGGVVPGHASGPGSVSSSCDRGDARGPEVARGLAPRRGGVRVFECGPGCVAGAADVWLGRPRSSTAVVGGLGAAGGSGACRLLCLSREALGAMGVEAPGALHVLQVRGAALLPFAPREMACGGHPQAGGSVGCFQALFW